MSAGVSLEAARRMLRGVVDEAVLDDPEGACDAYATAIWSSLVEPGDGTAGALVGTLGAVEALALVTDEGMLSDPRLEEGRRRWRPRLGDADLPLDRARDAGVQLVVPSDRRWPPSLDDLGVHAPLCLWVRGDISLLGGMMHRVAVVGARASTGYGEHVAAELCAQLAGDGVVIVSGGAYGIDGTAHRAALAIGGPTVAMLAGGVDRPYPAGHADLLGRIAGAGALVSEVPCGSSPTKWRFLQRNRCIAAAGEATVVVEAGWRSGSLNTAGHAAALGRPLGAVPGPVTSAASAGCHRLLRDYDATCITAADDVRELLGMDRGDAVGGAASDPAATRVLDALSHRQARVTDDVARRAGMAVAEAQAVLGMLELDGAVERRPDGWRRR